MSTRRRSLTIISGDHVMRKRNVLRLVSAMAIAFATSAAQATLIQANPFKIDQTGTGLGNVQTLLTLQSPGNSTIETGSIIAAGTGQATTGDTQAINNLQSFSGPASNLRLVFNPSEPQNDADGI